MHIAAKHGHYLIVKYLVETGCAPAIQNREGLTPFDFALQSKQDIELRLGRVHKSDKHKLDMKKEGQSLESLVEILNILTASHK